MITIILPFLLLVALAFFARTVLIVTGLLKGPVLRYFERYGDDESFYNPISPLLGWGGVVMLLLHYWLEARNSWVCGLWLVGALLLLGALMIEDYAQRHQRGIWLYPRWAYDISQRTSRIERRRLAYMWLHLPPRLRLTYNSNTEAFMQWADLVILSTLFY